MALASWSTAKVIAQLNSGLKWTGAAITYSFPTSSLALYGGGGERNGFVAFSAAQQTAATLALSLWDDLIAPNFVKVAPGESSTSSAIEFASSSTGVSYAGAYQPSVGSVWFNTKYNASTGTNDLMTPTVGQHGFVSYIHELGHALGLNHMGNYNGTASSPSSYQDSTVYSVMSYFGPDWGKGAGLVAWADWVGGDGRTYAPQTPMVNDILAIQTMYGAEKTTRIDNTVYGFNSTITGAQQSIFDFTVNRNPILAIFDSAGNDTLDLSGYDTASTIDLAPGAYSSCNNMTSNIGIAYTCDIENAKGGAGNDTISGNALSNELSGGGGNDTLYGLAGNDILYGQDGNDLLDGGIGADMMYGGVGNDIYFVDNAGDRVFELANAGIDTVRTSLINYLLGDNIEALEFNGTGTAAFKGTGNALTNTLTGGAGDDFLYGLAGDDTLIGQGGNDTLDGGSGADTMTGGAGNDIYFVDNAGDRVIEAAGAGTDTVKTMLFNYLLGDNVEALEFIGTGTTACTGTGNALTNTLTGGAGDDFLYGMAGNDTLIGQGGNDTLDGGLGADTMTGGAGDDIYIVDNAGDRVVETAGAGTDTVRTTLASYVLAENVETLEFNGTGTAGFKGTGNSLANRIFGSAGNDTLNGGLGADELWGRGGADFFDSTTALGGGNIDIIRDFNSKDDTIRLAGSIFTSFGSYKGVVSESAYWAGAAAHDADDRIIFNASTGALLYDSDGTGAAKAMQFATLDVAGLNGAVSRMDFVIM